MNFLKFEGLKQKFNQTSPESTRTIDLVQYRLKKVDEIFSRIIFKRGGHTMPNNK
jgi:hypothetical protein